MTSDLEANTAGRPRILLVDDEPRNLDALEAILENDEYLLLRADNADLALKLLLENGDDTAAIVLDIQMPQLNGIELARMIKGTRRFREIPILFLTAHMVDEHDVLTGYGVGAVDYLTKPLNPQILRQKVQVFGELYRKTRALAELNEKLEERVLERTADLEKSEAALRAAARQKDEFLAVLAHELRNPLAPLRTGVALLLRSSASETPIASRTLKVMDRQIDHLVRLIDDLLDVSRISNGVLELKKEECDLAGIVTNAVDTFRSAFEQKKINVSVDVKELVTGVVDSTRVAQIVGNLLHNAAKYTRDGGNVRVTLSREGDDAVVRVADDGIGIPTAEIGRVFEMFARVTRETTSNADRGAGIGLALARRLSEMHGGTLSASSPGEGLGTTFTLTLPAVAQRRTAVAAGARAEAQAHVDALDILVIEDSDDVADTLASWLEEEGHRVQIARTGETGVEMALAHKPDVVLCDVGLPEMDGTEVCRRVRERATERRPLMVALTGWGQADDRKRTSEAGFDHHLVKPVALQILTDVLRSASEAKRAVEN